jgi:hypothetical protein
MTGVCAAACIEMAIHMVVEQRTAKATPILFTASGMLDL